VKNGKRFGNELLSCWVQNNQLRRVQFVGRDSLDGNPQGLNAGFILKR